MVVLPLRALIGIVKAVAHLEREGWDSSKIAAWLLPTASYYSSRMEAEGDCVIYQSQNGYVRIKNEGNATSGRWLSVKIITEEPALKEQTSPDKVRMPLKLPPPSWLPCSRFDEYEAYWRGTFDL